MTRDQAQRFMPLLMRVAITGPQEAALLLEFHQAMMNIATGQTTMVQSGAQAIPMKPRAVDTGNPNAD